MLIFSRQPNCTATLGFLHLAKREAFLGDPLTAWESKQFQITEEAKQWPLLCAVDTSTQTLTVSNFERNTCLRVEKDLRTI